MYPDPIDHLPDPERQAAFYDGVTLKRGIAWLLDAVVILAITLPVAVMTIVGIFMLPVMFLLVGFLYRWFTIAGGSATWGMRLMAIELRDAHGRRLDAQTAFLHTLGYTVSMAIPILQAVSVVFMMVNDRGQGLTDLVLGTVALNKRA